MNFIALIRPYMRIFYLLGQTLYPLEYYLCDKSVQRTKWHRFSLMIPTLFMFFVKLALCVASISLISIYGEVVNTTYDIMSDIFLACELAKIFAVLYQNFTYPNLIGEILQNFQTIEVLFRSTLHCPIHFELFERAYKKKIGWAFGSYTMLMILFVAYYIVYGDIDLDDVFLKIMQFISISVYMNVLFFIDLVTFNLKHLNTIIARDHSECDAENVDVFVVKKVRTAHVIRQQISKYKFIHFRLWKTAQQINEFFGWTLITILLQSFVEFVFNTIWQLKILYDIWNFIRLTRKNPTVKLCQTENIEVI